MIYYEDCVLGMRQRLQDNSIFVIVTSSPYNIGTKYNNYDDNGSRDDYLRWCQSWLLECYRVLEDTGSMFLNMGGKPSSPLGPFQVLQEALNVGFCLQNTFHWIKSIAINDITYGHYKPVNSPRYVNDCHEYIFHFTKTRDTWINREAIGVPYVDKSNIARWDGEDVHCRGNCWFIPYSTIQKHRAHPAVFPEQLVRNCLSNGDGPILWIWNCRDSMWKNGRAVYRL